MSDKAAFLQARLDEDEVAAKAAAEAVKDSGWDPFGSLAEIAVPPATTFRRHVGRHDPARVLRDVEAGRKLLHDYLEVDEAFRELGGEAFRAARDAYGRCVLHRASGYSAHPDYRQEWKP